MSELEMDAKALTAALSHVADHVIETRRRAFSEHLNPEPDQLDADIDRFLTFLDLIDKGDHYPASHAGPHADRDQMADLGLRILYTLSHWAIHLQQAEAAADLDQVTLALALWCARHECRLGALEPLVDALSSYANRQSDTEAMIPLTSVVGEIIDAIQPAIQADPDRSEPHRPWRLLNFNYGIIATRSLQPAIMEEAFASIVQRFPEEAAEFFREGMEQMQTVDYPDYVRTVMEKYYQATNNPTLH